MSLVHKYMESPVGRLRLIASEKGLAGVLWERGGRHGALMDGSVENDRDPVLLNAERQLNEYFAGQRKEFDLELDMQGTRFQKDVWEALLRIPFGETRSYGDLARQLGNKNATRAVGAANGQNPIPIIVPCHRVIGANGKLTGFGGGLDVKAHLLEFEAGRSGLFQ